MSKKLKHDSLSKKVLLSVLAAGVMSTCVMGSALAADIIDADKVITVDGKQSVYSTSGENCNVKLTNIKISGQTTIDGTVLKADNVVGSDGKIKDYTVNTNITNSEFTKNTASKWGGALYFAGENTIEISNTKFVDNKADVGGAIGIYGYKSSDKNVKVAADGHKNIANMNNVEFINNSASEGGAIYVNPNIDLSISNSKFIGNRSTNYGGALMVKAGNIVLTDVEFNDNKVINPKGVAVGGVLLVDKTTGITDGGQPTVGDVTFKVTKDLAYIGNEVQGDTKNPENTYGYWAYTSGGFAFVDRSGKVTLDVANNATLTIGEAGIGDKTEYVDSIASALPDPQGQSLGTLTKKGDGTVVMNGSMNKFFGNFIIEKGRFELNTNDWTSAGNTVINAGELVTNNITLVEQKYTNKGLSQAGSITTAKDSTLTAKNIIVNAGSVKAEGTVNASVVYAANGDVTLNGGGKITGSYGLEGEMKDAAVAAVAKNGSKLTANNVDFTGEVRSGTDSEKEVIVGGVVTLTGGSVTATELTGKEKGYTELSATNGTLTANNVKINSNVSAHTKGTVEINNSNITAQEGISAEGAKSVVNLNGSADNVYTVGESLLAMDGGKININGGTLKEDALRSKMYNVKDKNPDREGATLNTGEKGIVLAENGIISTMSDQIYANAASATQKEAGKVTNEGIEFKGGTLSLNDAEYTLAYAKDAGTKVGPTSVVMTGKLAGDIDNKITVDEASKVGDNVALDKVTAETDGSLFVGKDLGVTTPTISEIEIKDSVANGFSVKNLILDTGSKGVVITNNKEVTLGGSEGGTLVNVKNDADAKIKVVVGLSDREAGVTGVNKEATLNIGNSLATSDTNYRLNGEVVVNDGSKLNVKGQTQITEALTLNGANVDATQGKLTTNKLVVGDDSSLLGEVKATSLGGANGKTLAIGDKDNAGKLTVEKAELKGATLFLDPAWKDGMTIGDASGFAVTDVSSALDGAYVAGQNSKLAFGADLAAAEAKFAKTGYTWGNGDEEISAAAYIAKSVDLGTAGSITVNGALDTAPTATAREVTFAKNSMLIVDAAQTKTEAAIKKVNNVAIGDSVLYIDEAKKGETYHILAGVDNGWDDQLIDSNNSLLKFTDAELAGEFAVTASTASVKDVFEGQVIAPNAYDATLNAKGDGDAAYDFIMAAADSKVNAGEAAQVSALNSAAAMSELAGVEHGTYAASNLLTDAVADHMSLANAKDHDSDIWAKYIHTKEDVDGLSIANFGADYDAQYNGIVVGADLYKNGKTTVGAALTYVDGNINGNTLAARTKNDATYYGASIYGGIQNEDSAVIGDISYLHGKNDITQYNSGKTLTADAKSDAFSIGVRAEKSVKAGVGKFVPYAGLRYMHLGTGNYTNSIGMSYDGDDMNLWLLPVGVKYSADVKTGSWTIRPIAEVGYVWNMGDRDATQTVSLNGASDGFGYDVTDSGSYIGRFMIEAEKANVTYGLGYEYQKGDSVKANRWMANLNWSF